MVAEDQPPTGMAKRILIIEDESVTQLATAQMVQNAGYIAITAADGAEAIKNFETESPDLILVDINLPGETFGQQLDGLAVIDWLHHNHPALPIKYIIVSEDDPERYKGRTAATGALCFIRKPIDRDLLLAEIKRAIGDPTDPGPPGT
jgi:CheY-like chemotaxis protein